MKVKFSAFIAVIMLCIASYGCADDADAVKSTGEKRASSEDVVNGDISGTGETETSNGSEAQSEVPYTVITGEMKNFSFEYPEAYLKDVTITELNNGDVYTVLFTAKIGEGSYDLFAVSYGAGADGELFGYLPSDGGNISVYIECYSLPLENSLAETEVLRYYELMDTINYVTESISRTDGFMYG